MESPFSPGLSQRPDEDWGEWGRGRAVSPASRPDAARGSALSSAGLGRARGRGRAGGRGAVGAASPGASLPLGRHPPHSHPPGRQWGLGAARAPFSASRLGGGPGRTLALRSPSVTPVPLRGRVLAAVRGHSCWFAAATRWGPAPRKSAQPPPPVSSRRHLLDPPGRRGLRCSARSGVRGRVLGSVWGCFESCVLNVQGLHRLDFPPNIRSRPVTSKSQIT